MASLQISVCNFTQSVLLKTPPWVFFRCFKLYKWYQIAQSVSYLKKYQHKRMFAFTRNTLRNFKVVKNSILEGIKTKFSQLKNTHYVICAIKVLAKFKYQIKHDSNKATKVVLGVIHLVRSQIFRKTSISYPLIHTRTSAYQG